ncbi:MAG: host-nuclease inhibitor Gam family protein [Candidatus Paceibacterota bacterium]
MVKKKVKAKVGENRSPQLTGEQIQYIEERIASIGSAKRSLDELQAQMDQQIEEVRESFRSRTQQSATVVQEKLDELYQFCEENAEAVTQGGLQQSVKVSNGQLGWRLGNTTVEVIEAEDSVIARIKQRSLSRKLLIQTPRLNKIAIKAFLEAGCRIKGVVLKTPQRFFVKPSETVEGVSKDVQTLQKLSGKK